MKIALLYPCLSPPLSIQNKYWPFLTIPREARWFHEAGGGPHSGWVGMVASSVVTQRCRGSVASTSAVRKCRALYELLARSSTPHTNNGRRGVMAGGGQVVAVADWLVCMLQHSTTQHSVAQGIVVGRTCSLLRQSHARSHPPQAIKQR
jgi:hypothetical protein